MDNRQDGRQAQWSMSKMVDEHDSQWAWWSISMMVDEHDGQWELLSMSMMVEEHDGQWTWWSMSLMVDEHDGQLTQGYYGQYDRIWEAEGFGFLTDWQTDKQTHNCNSRVAFMTEKKFTTALLYHQSMFIKHRY